MKVQFRGWDLRNMSGTFYHCKYFGLLQCRIADPVDEYGQPGKQDPEIIELRKMNIDKIKSERDQTGNEKGEHNKKPEPSHLNS